MLTRKPNLKERFSTGREDLGDRDRAAPSSITWAVGPVLYLPTATDDALGSGKWSAGPSVIVLGMPGPWVIGVLASNVWSYAGDEEETDVNSFLLQPILN